MDKDIFNSDPEYLVGGSRFAAAVLSYELSQGECSRMVQEALAYSLGQRT